MPDFSLFIPITKVDAAQHLVFGVATGEVEDRAGEICDYASTKPNYEKWSDEIARSTGGKSFGNLRAMHGPVAAGKVTAITFNDEARQIEICAKVVDEAEWAKVAEGVYTGFSQGGTYARRWTDEEGLTRYTAVPNEISLVDLPCLSQARFEMIKADGTREWRGFEPRRDIAGPVGGLLQDLEWLEEASTADETIHRYDSDWMVEFRSHVARVATMLRTFLADEDDGHPKIPGKSESEKQLNAKAAVISAHSGRPVTKISTKDRGDDQHSVQRLHDTTVELGAHCGATKITRGVMEKQIDSFAATLADVLQRIKNIEQQPLPLPLTGGTRAISKHEDQTVEARAGDPIDALLSDPDSLSVLAIKLAQRNKRAPFR